MSTETFPVYYLNLEMAYYLCLNYEASVIKEIEKRLKSFKVDKILSFWTNLFEIFWFSAFQPGKKGEEEVWTYNFSFELVTLMQINEDFDFFDPPFLPCH